MLNWMFILFILFAWIMIMIDPNVTGAHLGLCVIATAIAFNGQHTFNAHKKKNE